MRSALADGPAERDGWPRGRWPGAHAAGYRCVDNPSHRAEIECFWGTPAGRISSRPGFTAVEIFDALERGAIKAIWIIGTNPAVSMPDLDQLDRALRYASGRCTGFLSPD